MHEKKSGGGGGKGRQGEGKGKMYLKAFLAVRTQGRLRGNTPHMNSTHQRTTAFIYMTIVVIT